MADKDFGVKRINLVGAAGTPTITSPTDLIINANRVAISTNLSVAGISTFGNSTNGIKIDGTTGIITSNTGTAVTFFGNLTGTASTATFAGTAFKLEGFVPSTGSVGSATTATNLGAGNTGSLPFQNSPGITTFLDAPATSDQVLIYDTSTNKPKWGSVVGTGGAINGITVRDEGGTSTFNTIITVDIFGSNITATSGGAGIASIRVSDNLVGTSLSISGISTFGTGSTGIVINGNAGIITATSGGIVTYFGDGSKLSNIISGVAITSSNASTPQFIGFLTTNSGTTTSILASSNLSYIPSTGNLGIGTTNPTSKLWVDGDALISGISTFGTGNTRIVINGNTGIITAATSGGIVTYFGDGSRLSGIGSAASATNVVLTDDSASTSANIVFSQTPTQNPTASLKSNSLLIFNASNSSLGIGTAAPARNLHVQGDVRITGAIYAGTANTTGTNTQVLQSTGTGIQWVNTPTPSAAGSPGQIQFNSSGVLGGAPYFYYDTSKVSIGIGTTLPTGRLSIANTSTGSSLLLVNDNLSDGSLFRVNNNTGLPLLDVDAGATITMGYSSAPIALQVLGDAIITGILTAKVDGVVTGASGTSGQVQFNRNGKFAGAPYFHYDESKVSVGIGTSVPAGRLSIANTSTGSSLLLVNDNLSDGSLFRVNNNIGLPLLDVDAGGTIIMPITGNFGIGTAFSNPTSKLQVDGNMYIGGDAIITGILTAKVDGVVTGAAGTSGQVQFNNNGKFAGAPYFHYDQSRVSVGIGTSVPAGRLSIANTSTGSSLLIVTDNFSDGSLFRVNDNYGFPLFDIDAGGSVVFNTSGNVGIGSTIVTPTSKLQVGGNMIVSGILTATSYGPIISSGSISASGGNISASGSISATTTLTAGNGSYLSATSTGLGIGTANPTAKLQVVGTSNTSLLLVNENLSDGCLFRVADASANILFDVDASGSIVSPVCNNFGIGVFTPTAVLHLRGGTATASTAPLKFTSGTNLTTAEAGTVEYDGTVATLTPNVSLGRAVIATPIFTSGASPSTTLTGLTNVPLFPAANDTITLRVGTYLVETSFKITVATSTASANVAINIKGDGNAVGTVSWFGNSSIDPGLLSPVVTGSQSIALNSIVTPVTSSPGRQYHVDVRGIMKITSTGTLIPSVQWTATLTSGVLTWEPTNFMVITPLATSSTTAFTGAFS